MGAYIVGHSHANNITSTQLLVIADPWNPSRQDRSNPPTTKKKRLRTSVLSSFSKGASLPSCSPRDGYPSSAERTAPTSARAGRSGIWTYMFQSFDTQQHKGEEKTTTRKASLDDLLRPTMIHTNRDNSSATAGSPAPPPKDTNRIRT